MRVRFLWITVIGIIIGISACSGKKVGNDIPTVVVIPKGTTHEFWQFVHAGVIRAEREFEVNCIFVGPEKEDDRQQQIALVDNQVIKGVDGIVLAPLDDMALRRPVRSAVESGIPVIIFDSALQESEEVISSFIATDNQEGGRIGGRALAEYLGGQGKVILLRYMEGSASTDAREAGFLEVIAQHPGIEVVSDEQYGGATKAEAQQVAENLLMRFKDADGNLTIDGIFCPNASTTYGMMQTLRRQRLVGTVKFVGFDVDPVLIDGLRRGDVDGLVAQNPVKMGYLGVKTMLQVLKGETVPKRIDTGVAFVSLDNLEDPDIQELINPNLEIQIK